MSALKRLWDEFGQAIWLDYIQRSLVTGGGLARLVEEDGIRGVTSNPSIFQQAISGSTDYDEAIDSALAEEPDLPTSALYERLAVQDIRLAADVLRPVYESANATDGFVSLEVSPHLAHDSAATVDEARRLWREVARPNLMIKVPATPAGMPAVEALIADGINVNVTLIFSLDHYEDSVRSYLRGVERCADPSRVASVASFFVSRVDTAVDEQLENIGGAEALSLRGQAAVANARLAYRRFEEVFHGGEFAGGRRGAQVQRPLWASTSTKNPAYSDVLYIEELVAGETVNTVPTATLDAFRDHGRPRAGLRDGLTGADRVMDRLRRVGVDFDAVTERLQVAGVRAFVRSFDDLIQALETRRKAAGGA